MKDNFEVKLINKKLKMHGSNDYGEPIFRVVFSDDQTERRHGTFNEFHNDIFLRTVTETRTVPKYPVIKSKWILERWASGELAYHPSLITVKNGVYICVYVFQDVNKNYLAPLQKVCDIIVKQLLNPPTSAEILARNNKEDDWESDKKMSKLMEELAIESDESKTKDPKASRESMSTGYSKSLILTDQ